MLLRIYICFCRKDWKIDNVTCRFDLGRYSGRSWNIKDSRSYQEWDIGFQIKMPEGMVFFLVSHNKINLSSVNYFIRWTVVYVVHWSSPWSTDLFVSLRSYLPWQSNSFCFQVVYVLSFSLLEFSGRNT